MNTDRFITVDLETTMLDGDPDYLNPHNKAVLYGWREKGWRKGEPGTETALHRVLNNDGGVLIGHNLPFDLGYLLRDGWVTESKLAKDWQIWDTQLAEYILTGQQSKFISLEDLAAKYKIPFKKDDYVRECFKKGVVPEIKKLRAYCQEDCEVTEKIAEEQMAAAIRCDQMPLIQTQMTMRIVTAIMRLNGMKIDKNALEDCKDKCQNACASNELEVILGTSDIADKLGDNRINALELLKPPQLQTFLWGGNVKQRTRITTSEVYKSGPHKGQPKMRWANVEYKFDGYAASWATCAHTTEADTLRELLVALKTVGTTAASEVSKVLKSIINYREAKKILSTYVMPTEASLLTRGRVHPTIHMTSTNTGRTSCASPNLQNVPVDSFGNYRRALTADAGWKLLEFDYSQLEVIVAAFLSGDKVLLADIKYKDMHAELFKDVHRRYPSHEERRDFKRAVFAAFYGAGPATLAEQGNMTIPTAREFLRAFHSRYERYHTWKCETKTYCSDYGAHTGDRVDGVQVKKCYWKSPTNRVYTFKQIVGRNYRTKEKEARWSDQQIANYPVQGTATADIVPMMLCMAWRALRNKYDTDKLRFLMTVHDSLLVEYKHETDDEVMDFIKEVRELLSQVVVQFKGVFNVDVGGIEFKVGCKQGYNWEDMEEIDE